MFLKKEQNMGDASMSVEQGVSVRQPSKDAPAQLSHETILTKPNFADRIGELRISAQTHLQKSIQLLNPETPQEEPQKPVTPDDVLNHLEMLDKEESLPSSEYLLRSRQVLQESTQLKDSALAKKKRLEEQAHPLQADLKMDIDPRIEALNRAKGIRKLLVHRQKGRLTMQKSNTQGQLIELENQIQAEKQFIDQIATQERPIRQKQDKALLVTQEALMTTVGQEIAAIRSGYEQLWQEILQDGTIASDIRETYIQQIIAPDVERSIPDRENRDKFYQALHAYIDHREEPNIRSSPFRYALESFSSSAAYLAEPLLNREDEAVIKNLVAKIAADNIRPILNFARHHLATYDSRNKLDELIIVKYLGPAAFHGEAATKGTLGKEVYKYINKVSHLDWTPDDRHEILFWQGVKHSRRANELFGEEIQEQDQEYYSELLDASIGFKENDPIKGLNKRTSAIRDLKYYPTPDAIRNLVLITGVNSPTELAREAGRTLLYLSKKPEWKNILDEAEEIYPALSAARSILESLKSLRQDGNQGQYQGEYGWYPEIHQADQNFALSILESKPTDQRLTALAENALTNSSILEVLTKRDASYDAEAKTLREAEDFLRNLEETSFQEYIKEEHPVSYIEANYLRNVFRENLLGLMRLDESKPIDEMIASLKSLAALSRKILDNQFNYSTLDYLLSKDVVDTMAKGKVDSELIFLFPEQAPALMQDKMKETKIFVWKHGETMLKDTSDLKFLNRLVGEFGQKADFLIRGYQESLEAGKVTTEEKELVLEFAKQFRVVAPATLAGYKEAKQGGFEKGYIAQLKTLAEKMTGSGTITEEERNRPYYKDLLKHVYSNNAGQWSSFENNDSCFDRSGDLAGFEINPRYEIDLLSQSEIRIKAGETQNHSVQDEVQKPIIGVAEKMNALGHDKEKINSALKEDIDKTLKEIAEKGGLQGIDLGVLTSTEEKMFLILTDSIYGTRSIDPKQVKELVTTYEFATFEDISDYMAGTRDRVSRANNQDYALLCEVGAFYSDRIKEVNRRLVETAYKNPQIEALMPEYFRKLSQESVATQKQDRINRLRIERLGESESFVKQLTGVLEKRKGRKYEPEEVKEIIRRYEGLTGGLQETASISQNPQTKAFYGQLRSQRERTFEALQVITGEKADPKKVHLGEINLQQALDTETGIKEGKYNEEQFASYTAQRFIDLFEDERMKIEGELAKFESISGKQREILYGYITKTKESANARMVGGVCVAGDNPSKNKNQNMWDMPNYLQLVFQEPDTLQCQGLVLLHHFTQDGKRVLVASLNPSSTYLYSVDETAMFNGVMGTLEQFAKGNNFDMITFSQNKTIRTNRTGGQFEKTMDARIASVDKRFKFSTPETFSHNPKYKLQDMDVAWEKT